MEYDTFYTIDCSKTNIDNNQVFNLVRQTLITHGYVKVKCANISDKDCEKVCLNVIQSIGGRGCPYGMDPQALIWSVKVLALESDVRSVDLPGTNVDRELCFHTDCSYERDAPDYIALFVVQCDRTEQGGKFQLVHTKEILDQLSVETKRLLQEETYKIILRPAYRKDQNDSICLPIILPNECMRYQPDLLEKNQLEKETVEKRAAIAELNSIVLSNDKLNIFRPFLENNMMVLFNNQQFLHGRTKIEDLERHLLRVRFNLNEQ